MAKITESKRLWLRRRLKTERQLERSSRPLLTCFRSAKHMYAQIVDPETGRTLTAVSTLSAGVREQVGKTGNIAAAKAVGLAIAKLALEKEIRAVAFNRNGFVYHGRIKALADGAREGGLSF